MGRNMGRENRSGQTVRAMMVCGVKESKMVRGSKQSPLGMAMKACSLRISHTATESSSTQVVLRIQGWYTKESLMVREMKLMQTITLMKVYGSKGKKMGRVSTSGQTERAMKECGVKG
jgi:hypothetical protein